mmetsp:Transcript_10220/g.24606  ORF Transcript_10220/g.24606 Transcript_10220/m.24606 type:complete len:228 (-) Transcript_10220:286-969(-)
MMPSPSTSQALNISMARAACATRLSCSMMCGDDMSRLLLNCVGFGLAPMACIAELVALRRAAFKVPRGTRPALAASIELKRVSMCRSSSRTPICCSAARKSAREISFVSLNELNSLENCSRLPLMASIISCCSGVYLLEYLRDMTNGSRPSVRSRSLDQSEPSDARLVSCRRLISACEMSSPCTHDWAAFGRLPPFCRIDLSSTKPITPSPRTSHEAKSASASSAST